MRRMKDKFGVILNNQKVYNLDIPDDYGYMDEDLIDILKARAGDYIGVPD
ncbi:hypothetical protein [Metabacillus sp. RGM 3146]